MTILRYLTLVLLFLTFTSIASAQRSGPKATIQSFYAFDKSHSQVFSRKNIDARKKWFSSELYKLFDKELKREREYLAKNPTDKPHFGDGLPFQPLSETCSLKGKAYSYSISYGTVTVKGEVGNVDVHFRYPKGCDIPDILYAVNMEKEKGRWVISDIRYFPGDTSLVEDLNRKEY
jgi:hypothetical protein